jgi:quercetin dioxygenase-like cupin family protein
MKYTRIYSDEFGDSHFEEVEVRLTDSGQVGFLSDTFSVSGFQFRVSNPEYNWDLHNASAKQFVILLDGEIEITTSLGEITNFKSGDILLVEDTEGKGHKAKNVKQQIRKSIFVKI